MHAGTALEKPVAPGEERDLRPIAVPNIFDRVFEKGLADAHTPRLTEVARLT